ncbi:MAG: FecR protein [Acidimicrobiaceae bacterium]|jgi:uncharacterized cupin superfamily protein
MTTIQPGRSVRTRWLVLLALSALVACGGGGSKSAGASADATLQIRDQAAQAKAKTAADFAAANDGQRLSLGDTVKTNGTGFAQVNYHDGSLTRLDANAQFTLTDLSTAAQAQRVVGTLDGGRAWSNVQKVTSSDGRYEIDTSVATASVRGTRFNTDCTAADHSCTFTVIEGTVTVTPKGGPPIDLQAGESITVHADGTVTAKTTLTPEQLLQDPWIGKNLVIDTKEPLVGASSSSGGSANTPTVDLVFTGSHPFTAKGTKGRCGSGGSFSFEMTEADYPGVGQSFSIARFSNGGAADIKWVIDATSAYGSSANASLIFSSDQKTLTVDDELGHPAEVGAEHVHGTVTCPSASAPSNSSAGPAHIDPCVLSAAEVQAVVGISMSPGTKDGNEICRYFPTQNTDQVATVDVVVSAASPGALDAEKRSTPSGVPVEDISGVGDAALFADYYPNGELFAVRGGTLFHVSVSSPTDPDTQEFTADIATLKAQCIQLMNKLLSR